MACLIQPATHRLPSVAENIDFDYQKSRRKIQSLGRLAIRRGVERLGTWNTLTEEMAKQQIGKGIITEDCHNTHLINELYIPVALTGLQDTIETKSRWDSSI